LCSVQPPGAAQGFKQIEVPAFFRSLHSQRSARLIGAAVQARAASGPRSRFFARGGFGHVMTDVAALAARIVIAGERLGAALVPSATKAALLPPNLFRRADA
jgi:hypothetical protein